MERQTMPLRFRIWDSKNKEMYSGCSIDEAAKLIKFIGRKNVIISQDPGCRDDEGGSLYTGDIVEDTMFNFGGPRTRMVIQYNGYANVALRPDGLEDSLFGSSRLHKIGNIWQNNELLKEIK